MIFVPLRVAVVVVDAAAEESEEAARIFRSFQLRISSKTEKRNFSVVQYWNICLNYRAYRFFTVM